MGRVSFGLLDGGTCAESGARQEAYCGWGWAAPGMQLCQMKRGHRKNRLVLTS